MEVNVNMSTVLEEGEWIHEYYLSMYICCDCIIFYDRTYEGYVPHPVGQMSGIFKKTIGKFGLTPSGGCYTTKWSRRNPDKEVIILLILIVTQIE